MSWLRRPSQNFLPLNWKNVAKMHRDYSKMQAIWLSMRGNVKLNCVCKHSVEVINPQEGLKRDRRLSNETSTGRRSEHKHRAGPRRSLEHREADTHFIELSKGDTSRNIVEMIYQAAVKKIEGPILVISKVLKVENSVEMHKRFEKHRDTVKKTESDKKGQERQHPRVMVDGNELIQFYTTVITCNGINGLCHELSCGVCTTIRTGFETECKEKNGIVCSVGNVNVNGRKAVIVCRTIAGVMGYMNESIEGCDSVRSVVGSKLDYLIVRNPKAFLPCFVIVFVK